MTPIYSLLPVFLAAFIGSFLGVVAERAVSPRGIIFGRSACQSCQTQLTVTELIPLISWIALGGRCRSCRQAIGVLPFAAEIGAVIIAVWSIAVFTGPVVWVSCIFGWTLLALALTDFKYYLLPDFITLPALAFGLLIAASMQPAMLLPDLIGAIAGYGFVVLIRFIYQRLRCREGIGLGDAKLLAVAGAWVSWRGLPSVVLIAAVAALIFVLFISWRRGHASLSDRVPFGAFLCLGAWIVWLYGPLAVE